VAVQVQHQLAELLELQILAVGAVVEHIPG
jgi:hypothetical protein